jgi:hypothetical protein
MELKLIKPKAPPFWPSALFLAAANLMPLVGVLAWGWTAFPVMLLIWIEAVVIGAITVLKTIFAYPTQFFGWFLKPLFLPLFAPIVVIPYAIYLGLLAFFVFAVFAPEAVGHAVYSILWPNDGHSTDLLSQDQAVQVLLAQLDTPLAVAIGLMVAGHLVSFVWYFFVRGGCNRVTLREVAFQPMQRSWLMLGVFISVLILFGFGFGDQWNAPIWLLVPIILAKTALDLFFRSEADSDPGSHNV